MSSIAKFIRNTPVNDLRTYFDRQGFDLQEPVNWEAPEREIVKPLLKLVDDVACRRSVAQSANPGASASSLRTGPTLITTSACDANSSSLRTASTPSVLSQPGK